MLTIWTGAVGVGAGLFATAGVCITSGGFASDLFLMATIRMTARMIMSTTAPPEPRSGILTESRESRREGVVSAAGRSMMSKLLTNLVSFTLNFSSSQCCSMISSL